MRPTSYVWVLWLPPVWFYGMYETLLGGSLPVLQTLADRAWLALGGMAVLTAATYPFAYRRVVGAALVGPGFRTRRTLATRLAAFVPPLLTRDPVSRATIQFTMTTLGRVGLHRLVLAMSIGVALAFIMPVVGANLGASLPRPTMAVFAIPIVLMVFVIAGLRVAISLPADLAANWLFRTSAGSMRQQHRAGVRRVMWFAGVAVPLSLTLPAIGVLWGLGVLASYAFLCVAVGILVTEIAMRRFDGVPCTIPFEPGRAKLQAHWPWYLIGLLTLTITVPGLAAEFLAERLFLGPLICGGVLLVVATCVRVAGDRQPNVDESGMEPEPEQVGLVLH